MTATATPPAASAGASASPNSVIDATDTYCVIGAGPAGLATARAFQRNGIRYEQIERHSGVGGLWDIKNPTSTMYESAHLISSRKTTEFEEFPMGDDVADYPHHTVVHQYLVDFARHFGLDKNIRFDTSVERVEKAGKFWDVTFGDGQTKRYRGVAIANGQFSKPNRPTFPGTFNGEVIHSADYKKADIFNGKRVLIVGAGNSGCDIAVDAAHRAKKVFVGMRRGYHIIPKYLFGKPTGDLGDKVNLIKLPMRLKQKVDAAIIKLFVGNPQSYGIPEPDHKLYEAHPIVNSQLLYHLGHGDIAIKPNIDRLDGDDVVFGDGSREPIDLIVYATGYKLNFPFIDRKHLAWGEHAPQLYLNAFHPEYTNLFVLGLIESDGAGWQTRDWQSEAVARFVRAQTEDPLRARKFDSVRSGPAPDLSGGVNYLKLPRMAYYVRKSVFRAVLKKTIAFFD
ncbi:MAG: flavin-containing monooxygenase [Planctomycetota bacterium]